MEDRKRPLLVLSSACAQWRWALRPRSSILVEAIRFPRVLLYSHYISAPERDTISPPTQLQSGWFQPRIGMLHLHYADFSGLSASLVESPRCLSPALSQSLRKNVKRRQAVESKKLAALPQVVS